MDSERILIIEFLTAHASDGARVLERLPANEAAALLGEIPAPPAGEVLRRMSAFGGSAALAAMDPKPAAALLSEMPSQDASSLLRRIDADVRETLLAALPDDTREHLAVLLRYPEGTVGAVMDPFVLALPEDLTVGEALSRTRRRARHVYFYVYVTDRSHRLTGVLDLRELLLAAASDTLAAVMHENLTRVRADADVGAIHSHPGWQNYDALPVVDERGIFVGAIRHRMVRRMQLAAGPRPANAADTMLSLAELYWIGIGGILRGLSGAVPGESTGGGRNHGV
jgi:magnesium transporter